MTDGEFCPYSYWSAKRQTWTPKIDLRSSSIQLSNATSSDNGLLQQGQPAGSVTLPRHKHKQDVIRIVSSLSRTSLKKMRSFWYSIEDLHAFVNLACIFSTLLRLGRFAFCSCSAHFSSQSHHDNSKGRYYFSLALVISSHLDQAVL